MGNCCNSKEIPKIEVCQIGENHRIKFNREESYNENNIIKINITTNGGNPITMNINQKSFFREVRKKYCLLMRKNEDEIIVFIYKGKTIDENDSLYSLGIFEGSTIAAFDSNEYKC